MNAVRFLLKKRNKNFSLFKFGDGAKQENLFLAQFYLKKLVNNWKQRIIIFSYIQK
ncbi:hypothetical protein BH23BAC1_BH23BAC1_33700 [soil metagenome]